MVPFLLRPDLVKLVKLDQIRLVHHGSKIELYPYPHEIKKQDGSVGVQYFTWHSHRLSPHLVEGEVWKVEGFEEQWFREIKWLYAS